MDWTEAIEHVTSIAHLAPQASCAGLQRCLQHEWLFLQRVLPSISSYFDKLESSLHTFLHSLFGSTIASATRDWTSTPINDGGMAIPKPKEMANLNCIASLCQCTHLMQALKSNTTFDLTFHQKTISAVRTEHNQRKTTLTSSILRNIKHDNSSLPHFTRHVDYLKENGVGH